MNAFAPAHQSSPHAGHTFPGQTDLNESPPPVEPPQSLPVAKQRPTKYVIVETIDDVGGRPAFVIIDTVDAASDVAALKKAVPNPDPDLKYAAIPQRSFRLRGGQSTSKPVVKFS